MLAETCLERILEETARLKPALLVVDSVQTVFSLKTQSAPGSVGQVREAATQLLFMAKGQNLPTFLVGHVTKDGSLAGPKVLEHIVDTVLYFEGERHQRLPPRAGREEPLRRRGSELGVFEMTGHGPAFRAEHRRNCSWRSVRLSTPGSAVLCCIEGSRPLLVEVQALVSTSVSGQRPSAWRAGSTATVSPCCSRCSRSAPGSNLVAEDVYVNIAGGLTVDEPAANLAVVAAIASQRAEPAVARADRRGCSARWD